MGVSVCGGGCRSWQLSWKEMPIVNNITPWGCVLAFNVEKLLSTKQQAFIDSLLLPMD